MSVYPESDLLFHFPDDWVVRKYDGTVAYQSLSGHGLKGVDFIALTPAGELWFIEVKNYRPRFSNEQEFRANRPSPDRLADQVARKFTDSRRLLRIVDTALRRRWWPRLQLRWMEWRGRPRPNSNYWFWTEARRRLEHTNKLVCLLWMETPETGEDYDDSVARLLTERLPPGDRLIVAERERDRNLPIKVAYAPRN